MLTTNLRIALVILMIMEIFFTKYEIVLNYKELDRIKFLV